MKTDPISIMIEFNDNDRFAFRPADFPVIESQYPKLIPRIDKCHIYMICGRPKISFVPNSLITDGQIIAFEITYIMNGVRKTDRLKMKNAWPPEAKFVVSAYPHFEIHVLDENGEKREELIPYGPEILPLLEMVPPVLNSLETIYIGKSTGDAGSRNAVQRLVSHSTLQKILQELNARDRDTEIVLLLFAFEPPKYSLLFAPQKDSPPFKEALKERLSKFSGITFGIDEQVGLIEAALIRYFQPEYNEKYKTSFPKKEHEILKGMLAIEIVLVAVGLNLDMIGIKLFSKSIALADVHFAKIDLSKILKKRSFWEIVQSYFN